MGESKCLSCDEDIVTPTCDNCGFNQEKLEYNWLKVGDAKVGIRDLSDRELYSALIKHHARYSRTGSLLADEVFLGNVSFRRTK